MPSSSISRDPAARGCGHRITWAGRAGRSSCCCCPASARRCRAHHRAHPGRLPSGGPGAQRARTALHLQRGHDRGAAGRRPQLHPPSSGSGPVRRQGGRAEPHQDRESCVIGTHRSDQCSVRPQSCADDRTAHRQSSRLALPVTPGIAWPARHAPGHRTGGNNGAPRAVTPGGGFRRPVTVHGGRRSPGRCRRRRIAVRIDTRLPHLRPRASRPPALIPGTRDRVPGQTCHAAHLPGDHLTPSLGAARRGLDLRLSVRGEPAEAGARRSPGLARQASYRSYPSPRGIGKRPPSTTCGATSTPSRIRTATPAGSSPRRPSPGRGRRRNGSSAARSSPTGTATSSGPWPPDSR